MQQQHEWMHQQLVLRCQRAQVVANAVLRSAQVSSCGGCASRGTQQQQQQQKAQTQQHLPWYNQPHPEQLREVLKLPPFRFQTVVKQEPAILGFQSETLSLTVDALAAALHTTNKAVVGIIEERPAMLLTPHEPVEVLRQLAYLLQRRSDEAAFLLSPYPQLLALSPQQLQLRIDALAAVMQWPTKEQELRQVTAAAGVSFLQLLVAPVQRTQQQLEALATALGASQAACALLVQRQPHLLQMSPAVLRSRLFLLADASGLSCSAFLQQLQPEQVHSLSGLLLLKPARLAQMMEVLEKLLADRQLSSRTIVRLLLQLGSPHMVADAQVKWLALQSLVRSVEPWRDELAAVGEADLAVFLSVSHEGLAQVRYLAGSGQAVQCGLSLAEVVSCPAGQFKQRFGPEYAAWLAGAGA